MGREPIDIKEQIRLCGLEDESQIRSYARAIEEQATKELHQKKVMDIINGIQVFLENTMVFRAVDVAEFKKLNGKVMELIRPKTVTTSSVLRHIEESQEDISTKSMSRYRLKSFPFIEKASCGLQNGMYVFGAMPNIGKTSLLVQLAVDLLTNNDKMRVIFVSLDDDKLEISKKLTACMSFFLSNSVENSTTINGSMSYYDYFNNAIGKWVRNPEVYKSKKCAIQTLRAFEEKKWLIIDDSRHTLETLESLIEENKNENTVVIIDAVYKIRCSAKDKNERDEIQSSGVKDIAKYSKVPILAVKDLRKPDGGTITASDLKGNNSWFYDASEVYLLSSDDDPSCVKFFLDKNKHSEITKVWKNYSFITSKNIFRELI